MEKSERDLSLDVLRILACLMVVGIHLAMYGWYDHSPLSRTWTILNFYDTVFRPAVPLFVMISGSLFLRKERIGLKRLWLGSILHLVIIYVIWVVFYAVMNRGIHKSLADPAAVWAEITGPTPQYHLWYLRMLINLYAAAPLLWFLVRALDGKTFRYYFYLFFFFGILRHTVSDLPFLPKWILEQINLFIDMDLVGYAGYFILGYRLCMSDRINSLSLRKILTVYIAAVLLAAGLNQWISAAGNWPSQALYGNFSLPVMIEAVCIFIMIRKVAAVRDYSVPARKMIRLVSESTLFVYLIHPFVIQRLQMYFHLYTTDFNVLFSVPLGMCLVFVLSSAVGMALKRIPGLNRIL